MDTATSKLLEHSKLQRTMLVARKFLNLLIFSEEGHPNIRIEPTLMLFKSLNRFLGDKNKLI